MSVFSVSNSLELAQAFAKAADGDVIELEGGTYSAAKLQNQHFSDGVLLTSKDPGDPAVFEDGLEVRNVSGLAISDIAIHQGSLLESRADSHLYLRECQNISVSNVDVRGYLPTVEDGGKDPDDPETSSSDIIADRGRGVGIRVLDSQNVALDQVKIADVANATMLGNSSNVSVTNSEMTGMRDGITIYDIDNLLIADNYLHDMNPFMPVEDGTYDHPDFIQFWGVNSDTGVHNVAIQNNLFVQPEGSVMAQTIFGHMRKADPGVTATNFDISGNVIVNHHVNGIAVSDVTGLNIANNVLLSSIPGATDHADVPRISLNRIADATIDGNVVTEMRPGLGEFLNLDDTALQDSNSTCGDNLILSQNAGAENYWGNVYDQYAQDLTQLVGVATGPMDMVATDCGIDSTMNGPVLAPAPTATTAPAPIPAPSMQVITGTDGDDKLIAGSEGGQLLGLDGNDRLLASKGQSEMSGGAGADRFNYDLRSAPDGSVDGVILDLDFSEGDSLTLLTSTAHLFDDLVDLTNTMKTTGDGAHAVFDSVEDIREAVMGGALTAHDAADGSGVILALSTQPNQSIKLAGYDVASMGLNNPVFGTDADETLRAQKHGSFVDGGAGDDRIYDSNWQDTLRGGEGADQFLIDFRKEVGGDDIPDILMDLDFAEGDSFTIITVDTTHQLDSLGTIIHAVNSGALEAESSSANTLILRMADDPENAIEIQTLSFDDLAHQSGVFAGLDTQTGTSGNDTMRAAKTGSIIDGLEGNDNLYSGRANDQLTGGEGADRFNFDLRNPDLTEGKTVITDLDFDEGDTLIISTDQLGTFDDSADLTNALKVSADGSSAVFDSMEDLREAVDSGALVVDGQYSDRLVLSSVTDPDKTLELLTITEEELNIG